MFFFIYLSTDLIFWYDMMLQQQYLSCDLVSLSTHLIHGLDWSDCDVRMKMYDIKSITAWFQKWWSNKKAQIAFSWDEIDRGGTGRHEEDASENNWTQRVSVPSRGGTDDFLVTFIASGSWI